MNTIKQITTWVIFSAFYIFSAVSVNAAAPSVVTIQNVAYHQTKLLPSKIPLDYFQINFIPRGEVDEKSAVTELVNARWTLTLQRDEKTVEVDNAVQRVNPSKEGTGVVYLYLSRGSLNKDDKITDLQMDGVSLNKYFPNKKAISVPSPVLQPDFHVDPKQVPNAELLNGDKKDVFQVGVKFDYPVVPLGRFAVLHLESDDLISSESKDKNSKLEFKLGVEGGIPITTWYVPWFIDSKFLANQSFSNTSVVSTAGSSFILPWRWTTPYLWDSFIKAPISPTFAAGLQYENRIKKDPLVSASHDTDNLFRINGQVEWKDIHFTNKEYSPKDVSMEVKAEGWYFPSEKATGGASVRKLEGHLNLALYIPFSGLPQTILDPPKDKMWRGKIEYDEGANEANGFVRSSTIKFGIEITTP